MEVLKKALKKNNIKIRQLVAELITSKVEQVRKICPETDFDSTIGATVQQRKKFF